MESQQIATMFTVQGMRKFVCDRLTEAAQEILGAFEKRAQEYELELARQRRLLESVYSPANTCLSDATGPSIKEEQNDIYITDIQRPVSSTSLQDVPGESQLLKSEEVQDAARKEQEGVNASQRASTEVSSPAQVPTTTQKTATGNKRETTAKHVHNKCSHGYRMPKGGVQKHIHANKNKDMPEPSSSAPTAMEVIEIEDTSPVSSDIEIVQGNDEQAASQNVNKEIYDTACDEKTECTEPLSQNKNEEKSSLSHPPSPVLGNNQDIVDTIVDSIGNSSSDFAITSFDFPIEFSDPPDFDENMTLPDDTNSIKEPVCENAIPDNNNDDELSQGTDGKAATEIPSQVKYPNSVVIESNSADDGNKRTFTNLDDVGKMWQLSTEQAIYDIASASFTGTKIDTDTMQPVFTDRYEINTESSSANQETAGTQMYSYEWKRPTKALGQDNQTNALQCDICGKVSSNFKNYRSHVKLHTTEKRFKCETCGKMFRESWDLNKHQKIHTGEKPFECPDCGRAFNRRFNLDLHKRVHTGEKPYACGSCDKAFTSRVNLRKHERIHTGEKPYTCEHCQKEFADSSSFRNHQRVHTGEKPYKCCFCKKKFATRTTLKRHTRVHTGEKPYKCSVCEKSFTTNTDMKVHTRIHTGERPYKCEICGQEFSSWTNYNRHTNIHKPKAAEPMVQ